MLSDYLISILTAMFSMHGVTQVLIPVLPKNSVIMMDNGTFHKKQSIQQVIIDAGHMVEYLPTYSPDLNPIEHKWAQAKCKKERWDATQIFCSHSIWCNQN
ncbi:transposase [Arsenophonus endosymbiont of Bemisia tabaci]|uniref:transposase n=1 Tax=Arsenophonus endosymbiont of Bemisia tabaci TaxID=536059 RepID=UPI0021072B85|nr:transposase [Arsenophonus endosymbiont of Bemisia tabaci]